MALAASALIASLGMEAATAKQIEIAVQAVRRTFRGMNLVSDVSENGLEPMHIVHGLAIARSLDTVDDAMKIFDTDMLDSMDKLDGGEALDLEASDRINLDTGTDAADNPVSHDAGDSGLDRFRVQVRDSFLGRRERLTKAERSPGKMAREAAERIARISPSQDKWERMPSSERLAVLRRCFSVLGEEACLPQKLIESTDIGMDDLDTANAYATFFIEEGSPESWFSLSKTPYIAFSSKNLENPSYSFDECVSTLYHEVMHILQQQCLLEAGDTVPYVELKAEWAAAIRSRVSGTDGYDSKYINYLSNSLEIFAIQQKELFRLMLDCYKSEMR